MAARAVALERSVTDAPARAGGEGSQGEECRSGQQRRRRGQHRLVPGFVAKAEPCWIQVRSRQQGQSTRARRALSARPQRGRHGAPRAAPDIRGRAPARSSASSVASAQASSSFQSMRSSLESLGPQEGGLVWQWRGGLMVQQGCYGMGGGAGNHECKHAGTT
jgi:hypothetical protein